MSSKPINISNKQLLLAIKALDDPFRSIVIMRDIQGMSYAEIQGSLDMSSSQVKVYLHRGRRKLRDNSELRTMFESYVDPNVLSRKSSTNESELAVNDKGNSHAK